MWKMTSFRQQLLGLAADESTVKVVTRIDTKRQDCASSLLILKSVGQLRIPNLAE